VLRRRLRMPQTSQTKRSTRKLSEVARHVVIPAGIVSSGWSKVEARCAEWGDSFDEWQRGAGRVTLGKRANGEYAATVGGITYSIPRQVAKTFLVMRIVFALCTLFPGLTVLWSAHRTRTASKTFGSMRALAQKSGAAKYVKSIRAVNGEQEIHFTNGSVIMFGAREQGFGRGFDEVDIEVFDEAQILTEKALEDMVAATNQSRFPAGALLFFMGTPPRPVDPGEAFKARRREALAGETEDAVYIECSADPDADPDDREQWAIANPSFPHRTPVRSMLRLRKNLPSAESWRREALGIWDSDQEGSRYFSGSQWVESEGEATGEGYPSYAVAFSTSGERISVGGHFGTPESGHVELIDALDGDSEAGLVQLADWFVADNPDGVVRWRAAQRIVLSGAAGAGVLRQYLLDRKVPPARITVANTPQYLQACEMFRDAMRERSVTHRAEGQSVLDNSVAVTDKDRRGGWISTVPDGDETPLEAVSLALWGARTTKLKPRGDGERKAVFL
jgi:hypothetical protein